MVSRIARRVEVGLIVLVLAGIADTQTLTDVKNQFMDCYGKTPTKCGDILKVIMEKEGVSADGTPVKNKPKLNPKQRHDQKVSDANFLATSASK